MISNKICQNRWRPQVVSMNHNDERSQILICKNVRVERHHISTLQDGGCVFFLKKKDENFL